MRYPAHNHVNLDDVPCLKNDSPTLQVLLGFGQRKGTEIDLSCQAVMQPTLVVHDVLDNPGRSASADDEEKIGLCIPPVVPEMFKGRNEIAPFRGHAGQFVDEHHLLSLGFLILQKSAEAVERIFPVDRIGAERRTVPAKGLPEIGELLCLRLP